MKKAIISLAVVAVIGMLLLLAGAYCVSATIAAAELEEEAIVLKPEGTP